ncbi:unknown protein [Paenibacillus amylolyticus]|uniref:Uncharacterized protein n=1 Tax=Paenibacillus amylolyticus TaxID=1451 RepID=A0A100VTZ3_PAEAM|nr:unknown protein [Paenibacillus amylolyticus]
MVDDKCSYGSILPCRKTEDMELDLTKKDNNYLSVKVERKRKKTVSPRANGFSYMFRSG